MADTIKWWNMSIGEQIGNAGSEVARAIRRKNKNDMLGAQEFCIHAIEMLGFTRLDPKIKTEEMNCFMRRRKFWIIF